MKKEGITKLVWSLRFQGASGEGCLVSMPVKNTLSFQLFKRRQFLFEEFED